MHTWGRTYDAYGNPTWQKVATDSNGNNDAVYLVTLAQVLKLNLGESPFFANYGIPAMQTIMTQVFPDFYAAQAQGQFAPFFSSLIVRRVQAAPAPTYTVNVQTRYGATVPNPLPV